MSTILTQEQITYATTILDKVVKGLANQGFEQSMLPGSITCAYRGKDGMKCAVGHIIPDDHELIEQERANIRGVGVAIYLNELHDSSKQDPILSPLPITFWRRLQFAHDSVENYTTPSQRMKHNLHLVYREFKIPMSKEIQSLLEP